MLDWLTSNSGSKKKKTTRFFDKNMRSKIAKLDELHSEQARRTVKLNEDGRSYLKAHELRERIGKIRRRNKERSILVVPFSSNDNPLVDVLLDANSNADVTWAESVPHAQTLLALNHYDMIYAVVDMKREGEGPCFFSSESKEDAQLRDEYSRFLRYANSIKPLTNGAEIVVVCGTSKNECPLADKLFKEERADEKNP